MAQSGYTPISLYFSTTSAAVPTAGNLVAGELALNTNDGKLYYKNSSGVVTLLAGATSGPAGGSNTQVQYNSSGALAGSANLTFNGTTLTANTIGAFTLSGTVAGGGNNINNVIIGASSPLAGAFTTLSSKQTSGGTTALTIKSFDSSGGNQPLGVFQRSDAAVSIEIGYDGTTGNSHVGTTTAHDFEIWRGGSIKATATSTGLAVTGTLTSTLDATIYGLTVGRGGGAVSTNTAVGASALAANTTASYSTAIGYQAGLSLSSGIFNTFIGAQAGKVTYDGRDNVAMGLQALAANTSGSYNTSLGSQALAANTTASQNTAVGYQAGYSNVTGANLAAFGNKAGTVSTGNNNTYIGAEAGLSATSGTFNTFVGYGAGYLVTTGGKNSIIGAYSGNQGGLDIRTASNYIVLSDGDGNPRGIFDSSGNLLVGVVTANANGGVLQLKSGITFPATQSASTDANTLDDYEEGTWTPSLKFGGASVGMTGTFEGYYTKIGRLVSGQGRMILSAKGSSTGAATLALPFTSAATNTLPGMSVGYYESWASSITASCYINSGSALLQLTNLTGTTVGALTDTNFTNATRCDFSFSYIV
jgi:hypothetical protein